MVTGSILSETKAWNAKAGSVDVTCSIPTGDEISLTIYQDTSSNGTSDNQELVSLSNGTNTYTLSNFQRVSSDYWIELDFTSNGGSPSIDSIVIEREITFASGSSQSTVNFSGLLNKVHSTSGSSVASSNAELLNLTTSTGFGERAFGDLFGDPYPGIVNAAGGFVSATSTTGSLVRKYDISGSVNTPGVISSAIDRYRNITGSPETTSLFTGDAYSLTNFVGSFDSEGLADSVVIRGRNVTGNSESTGKIHEPLTYGEGGYGELRQISIYRNRYTQGGVSASGLSDTLLTRTRFTSGDTSSVGSSNAIALTSILEYLSGTASSNATLTPQLLRSRSVFGGVETNSDIENTFSIIHGGIGNSTSFAESDGVLIRASDITAGTTGYGSAISDLIRARNGSSEASGVGTGLGLISSIYFTEGQLSAEGDIFLYPRVDVTFVESIDIEGFWDTFGFIEGDMVVEQLIQTRMHKARTITGILEKETKTDGQMDNEFDIESRMTRKTEAIEIYIED